MTGASGCVGAWVLRQLVAEGRSSVAFDLTADTRRLRFLLDDQQLKQLTWVTGDITDLQTVERVLDDQEVGAVIHLAALQAPFCRDNPPLGALVNVVGTVNLLEAAARRGTRVRSFVYASSVAAADGVGATAPATIYGVYKRAGEQAAQVYLRDRGLASIGLRPHTVYGPGRDQGMTSAPTVAMLAAASGTPYEIPFTGRLTLQYAPDVAAAFVAASDVTGYAGADVFDLPGETVDIEDVLAAITAAAPGAVITASGRSLPFPADVAPRADAPFADAIRSTPLAAGVTDAIDRFRSLREHGLIGDD